MDFLRIFSADSSVLLAEGSECFFPLSSGRKPFLCRPDVSEAQRKDLE
jgi:hypothetical protein